MWRTILKHVNQGLIISLDMISQKRLVLLWFQVVYYSDNGGSNADNNAVYLQRRTRQLTFGQCLTLRG